MPSEETHIPLPSDLERNKPVKARFWSWLEPFFLVKVFETTVSCSRPGRQRRGGHSITTTSQKCAAVEAGSYSRLIDLVYHSTLGLRVMVDSGEEGGRA